MALKPKENFMEVINFGKPEYIPFEMGVVNMLGLMPNAHFEQPVPMGPQGVGKIEKDAFGVEWTASSDGMVPVNDHFLLEDVTEWRDVVKIPDVNEFSWEQMAEKELANADPDKVNLVPLNNGLFDRLMACMGFNEGLCALYEEPEACKEFFEAVADYKIAYIDKICEYYKPDVIQYVDDLAHANGMFMSPEVYRQLIKPQHKRIIDAIKSHGVVMEQHTCGKCEQIIPDYIEMGVQIWFPAQTSNHLKEIHDTHKIALDFGMDSQGVLKDLNVSEEILRSETDKAVRELGDGGGLILSPLLLPRTMESSLAGGDRRAQIIKDELGKVGKYNY